MDEKVKANMEFASKVSGASNREINHLRAQCTKRGICSDAFGFCLNVCPMETAIQRVVTLAQVQLNLRGKDENYDVDDETLRKLLQVKVNGQQKYLVDDEEVIRAVLDHDYDNFALHNQSRPVEFLHHVDKGELWWCANDADEYWHEHWTRLDDPEQFDLYLSILKGWEI